jgi:hypothetical protein
VNQLTQAKHSQYAEVIALLVATAIGAGSAWLMATLVPSNKSSWLGLALIPLWFLLEALFELAAAALGSPSKISRALAVAGLLGGFYATWFTIKGLAP